MAAKKMLEEELKPELWYYEIKHCCIHGGEPLQATERGLDQLSKGKITAANDNYFSMFLWLMKTLGKGMYTGERDVLKLND